MRETLALIWRLIFIDIFLDDASIIASCYDARFFLQNPYARTKVIKAFFVRANHGKCKTQESRLSSTSSFNSLFVCVSFKGICLVRLPSKSLFLGADVLCFLLVYNERPSGKNSKGRKLLRFATLFRCLLLIFLFTIWVGKFS